MDIKFIGWCNEGSHDKVWGLAHINDSEYMTFWGRRGKKLQTNSKEMSWPQIRTLINSKLNKGYQEFSKDELGEIHENFRKQVFVISLKG